MSFRDFVYCVLLEIVFSVVVFVLWVVVVLFFVVLFCFFVCFRNCFVDLIMEMMVMWCWCCEGYLIFLWRFLQILFCFICVFFLWLSIVDFGLLLNDCLCIGFYLLVVCWVCLIFFFQRQRMVGIGMGVIFLGGEGDSLEEELFMWKFFWK